VKRSHPLKISASSCQLIEDAALLLLELLPHSLDRCQQLISILQQFQFLFEIFTFVTGDVGLVQFLEDVFEKQPSIATLADSLLDAVDLDLQLARFMPASCVLLAQF
jgi:hypothetical protein